MSRATARAVYAKLVLISGRSPPIMVKTSAIPGSLPIEVFDGLRQQLAANRAQFYRDFSSQVTLYGYRSGAPGCEDCAFKA